MAKEVKKSAKTASSDGGRVRKMSKKQARGKAKKEIKTRKPLPGVFSLTAQISRFLAKNWKIFSGIVVVYLLLNILFASGISNISDTFSSIKADLNASGGQGLWRAAGGFGSLVASSGSSTSATGSVLQSVLFVLESLVIIWSLRHLMANQKITVKMAYYKSMTPLIPFLLVIGVIIIQLLPMTIGGVVLAAIAGSVFAGSSAATIFTTIAFFVLAAWSIYMISSSIFALYIVTLPDTQPRQALRAAKELVQFRRWLIIRKVLFLPLVVLLVMALITVPLILYVSFIVPLVFFVLSMLAILFVHSYLYSLYRGMLE